MAASAPPIVTVIAQLARARGLDPNAVLAVAGQEGLSGAVGDHGTSFGPFQLHQGGELPGSVPLGQAQRWATSPGGLGFALDRINGVAHGLRGNAAIEAIVRRFERPADPSGEIARAEGSYGHAGIGALPNARPNEFASAVKPLPNAVPGLSPAFRQLAAQQILQGASDTISGRQNPAQAGSSLISLAALRSQLEAAQGVFGSTPSKQASLSGASPSTGVAQVASKYLGVPYRWGSTDPSKGLDCSSFLQRVYADMGVKIPRVTTDQLHAGRPVPLDSLKPGDAVFTEPGRGPNGGPGHVGLYIGNGQIQESPHTGDRNKILSLKTFLGGGFVGARRYT